MAKKLLIDMTDVFTEEGAKKLKRGEVLIFQKAGVRQAYKIVSKAGGKVWGREVRLYKPEEIKVVDKEK